MMAAPNQSQIKAKVLRIEQHPQFSDKWNLELEILALTSDTNFVLVGQKIKAFTIATAVDFLPNSIITAQAEFLGDQRGGVLRLTQVQVVN